jgi:hypothetical protein
MAAYADEERALPDAEGWRWSFLVRDAEVVAAGDAVRAWASAHGVEAEVTGPWPPFSFCREESA